MLLGPAGLSSAACSNSWLTLLVHRMEKGKQRNLPSIFVGTILHLQTTTVFQSQHWCQVRAQLSNQSPAKVVFVNACMIVAVIISSSSYCHYIWPYRRVKCRGIKVTISSEPVIADPKPYSQLLTSIACGYWKRSQYFTLAVLPF